MNFGFFDDRNREYVITTPKTPLPWINYLGCNDFFSLISNTCGGYSFYKDAKLLRLTRYRYNNVPADTNGKYFYLKDGDTIWNPGWQPSKTPLDFYECRHGIGYSRFLSSKNGLSASVLTFVPMNDSCEISQIKLTNESGAEKNITLFSYVEWCLWNADDDMKNFQRNLSTGEVELSGSAIFHKTEYRERRNHYAVYSVNTDIDGFDTDRDAFLGAYRGADCPQAVENGACTNSIANGWSPIASHQVQLTLSPGETKSLVFVLGYIENNTEDKWESYGIINKKPAFEMIGKYQTDADVESAFAQLNNYWKSLLSNYTIQSANDKVNRMVNIWNQYQCMITFNMSRSASYYESGIGRGMGFRDSCQDLLGFVHLIPERARERIIDIASTQFPDGSAYHQYQPLTKKGNSDIGSGFNDDPLWLIAGTSAYVRETGDTAILAESVPFNNDTSLAAPLMEHLKRSFDYIVNHKGPHALPLIGRADWNDCLRLGANGESSFVAMQFYYAMTVLKQFAGYMKDTEYEKYLEKRQEETGDIIQKLCWDQDRFIRGYTEAGDRIGAAKDPEANLWLNPQSWSVISGLAAADQADTALTNVYKQLNTEYGALLMNPPYHANAFDGALAVIYNQGTKENAGIFSQSQGWLILAEALCGHGERAFTYFIENAPAAWNNQAELRCLEPYCYGQFTEGRASKHHGRSHVHWLTGTASTMMVGCVEGILGLRPDLNGITLSPAIPKSWTHLEIEKDFRGKHLHILIENPNKRETGYEKLILNGTELDSNYIPADCLKDRNHIQMIL